VYGCPVLSLYIQYAKQESHHSKFVMGLAKFNYMWQAQHCRLLHRAWATWHAIVVHHHYQRITEGALSRERARVQEVRQEMQGLKDKMHVMELQLLKSAVVHRSMGGDTNALRMQIEQERREKAGRQMRHCLNKIANLLCLQGMNKWVQVHCAIMRAGRIMNRVMWRFTNAQLVSGWERWHDVLTAQQRAGAVMKLCLARITNAKAGAAMSKWLEAIDADKQLSESDALRAHVERERQEKAGRLIQYTLNKILNARYVQAWDKWTAVNRAMERAGKVMNRVMVRFTSAQLVSGWERWLEVLEAQQHAGLVMERCMGRILNAAVAPAMSKWSAVIDYEKQEHRRTHGIASAVEAEAALVASLKSKLFVIYITVFRMRMITGAFLTWIRFMHLAANKYRAGLEAAAAATAASGAAAASKQFSIRAELATKGDVISVLLVGLERKKLSGAGVLQSHRTVIRMLRTKAKADDFKSNTNTISGRDFIVGYFEVKHGKTNVAKRKVEEFLLALAASEVRNSNWCSQAVVPPPLPCLCVV
jgi:hypothetical protein